MMLRPLSKLPRVIYYDLAYALIHLLHIYQGVSFVTVCSLTAQTSCSTSFI